MPDCLWFVVQSPRLMPPTSWVELALAGLAEARSHDGRRHRESLLSQLQRILANLLQKQFVYPKNTFMTKTKNLRRTHWPLKEKKSLKHNIYKEKKNGRRRGANID